jgi:septal ring factor EnvC (AmiA/AmiB activator)
MEAQGSNLMADIIQFPSKHDINKVDRLRELNEALDRQEQMLQDTMRELDMLNEEIVTLTTEYNSMLQQLKDLVLNT